MRLSALFPLSLWGFSLVVSASTASFEEPEQQLLLAQPDPAGAAASASPEPGVSPAFFASLERYARLVDIAYCVGTTGITAPFSCASRCADFPTLRLVSTWDTGALLSDSCGFVAVDHGLPGTPEDSRQEGEADIPHGPAIVVVFRGTYSIANTIVDLSTIPQEYVPYPPPDGDGYGQDGKCANCTVHTGFLASWRNARKILLPVLETARAQYPGYPVHLVGHSLGGAVACLAALELRLSLGWEDVVVTTYGEPRVGNKDLVGYIDKAFGLAAGGDPEKQSYRRVTHAGDPVPLLPLTEWGYVPHAGEVFIAKSQLQPAPEDVRICHGDNDAACSGGGENDAFVSKLRQMLHGWLGSLKTGSLPTRFRLSSLFTAHRDYFWRIGLCVPGGDPWDWGRKRYNVSADLRPDERRDVDEL